MPITRRAEDEVTILQQRKNVTAMNRPPPHPGYKDTNCHAPLRIWQVTGSFIFVQQKTRV